MLTDLEKIKNLHKELKLSGMPKNALLNAPDGLLDYFIQVMRDEKEVVLPIYSYDDWQSFIKLLALHGVLPLFYWHIKLLPKKLHPPEKIFSYLKNVFLLSSARSLKTDSQLALILEAFEKEKIEYLVLKGKAYEKMIYPNSAIRPSNDIDILILPNQVKRGEEILLALKYECKNHIFDNLKEVFIEEVFIDKNNKKAVIDLHWSLHGFLGMNNPDNDMKAIFDRKIEVKGQLLSFKTLDLIDSLIHAAIHARMIHGEEMRLIWLYDISLLLQEIIAENRIYELKDKSVAFGARLAVESAVKISQLWSGFKIPIGLFGFDEWPKPTKQEINVWENFNLRSRSIISWYNSRWPKNLNWRRQLRLFFNVLFSYKRKNLSKFFRKEIIWDDRKLKM